MASSSDDNYVLRHQGLVRSIAVTVSKQLPSTVDLDDLISYGQVGLVQAAQDYEPSRGVQFATFAYYRIRGAIFDGVSQMSWLKESQYRKHRLMRLAEDAMSQDEPSNSPDGPNPTSAMHQASATVGRLLVIGLALEAGERGPRADLLRDTHAEDPSDHLQMEEAHVHLQEAVLRLPEDERALVEAVYFRGLSLTAAAKCIRKSTSWASRLHIRALTNLATSLQNVGVDSPP